MEEPGGVTGLVSLRKTAKKSRGLREMANSVTGTLPFPYVVILKRLKPLSHSRSMSSQLDSIGENDGSQNFCSVHFVVQHD